MAFVFEILGISPVIKLLQEQEIYAQEQDIEYLGVHHCTLDTFVSSVEDISQRRHWHVQQAINTVMNFWVNNPEKIKYWAGQLEPENCNHLLLARVGKLEGLRTRWEGLFYNDL
ncbi:hypothetical protein L3556_10715 [Candidatus Synechococcus calcipolaris G9]|uniref:Uncharacterized protein n=1 Tax=Candidatus Synechococcus calcipolaris G9 TaxID=1497997 RepID=A0ABT6F0L1_9SYNE|nr:hypothetical protein [Candidatus Synechococcus calcipolaris]MDG2991398.1 hypothetical protein [Candidatus Synechococcus calcipolaris G9]